MTKKKPKKITIHDNPKVFVKQNKQASAHGMRVVYENGTVEQKGNVTEEEAIVKVKDMRIKKK